MIWMLYSSLVGVAVVSAYIPAIEETHQAYAAYHQYMDYTLEDMVNAATAGEIDYGEVSQAVREYETKLDSLAMGSYLCLLASLVVFQVVFGLIANCLYRRYVERDNAHARHLGHILQDRYPPLPGDSLDYEMTREEFAEKFEKLGMTSFTAPGGRIDVDATYPETIDVKLLIEDIEHQLAAQAK